MKFQTFFWAMLFSLSAFAQFDTVSNISNTEKIYGLSMFWSEAKYNFAYFDKTNLNWDSAYNAFITKVLRTKSTWEYYDTLKKFSALLRDGHTNVYEPGTLYNNTSRYKYQVIENFNKRLYITNIPVQYKDKAPVGSEVIGIEGMLPADYLKKYIFPYISASTEHQLWNDGCNALFYGTDTTRKWDITLKTPDGKTIHHLAEFHTIPATWLKDRYNFIRFDFKITDQIAVVKIGTFGDEKIIDDFKAILPQLYQCKGVIIDLRQNGGGNSEIGAEILKYFTDNKKLIGSTWKTRDNLSAFKAWGEYFGTKNFDSLGDFEKKTVMVAKGNYWYKGDTMSFENNITDKKINSPLIVLFGNNTASAAEDFLVILSNLKGRAVTIGQRSYGSTGQPLQFDLPGGGSARVCTKRDTYPDGREFVGYGIKPDIEIEKNINDVVNGKDTELEYALKYIRRNQ